MRRAPELRGVLFDLDGTLIDSAPDLGAAANDLRIARGLAPLPLDTYRPMAGAGARGMLGIAFDIAPEHPDYAAMRELFFQRYAERLVVATALFPDVPPLLEALEMRGLRWGIVTNKIARFTTPLVAATTGLRNAAVVISGDTTPHPKPHPAPLHEAVRRLGVAPAQCVYVGDDERDIAAGRAAGMATIAAGWGYLGDKTDIAAWGANTIAATPGEVLKWLVDAA